MYSVVLATMLTTGSAAPSFGFGWHGCHGCYGCCGGYYTSCYGCCGGCYGCYGCCGGYYTSCYGCYGCCGGCYGCWGCHGCCGGTVVYTYPVYPAYTYYPVYSSCYGCCGTVAVVPVQPAPPVMVPATPPVAPKPVEKKTTSIEEGTAGGQVAKVIIAAPADVRVSVNGTAVKLKSAEQAFVTPELEPGASYSYIVKAEAVRDGKTLSTTRKVMVAAGSEVRVDLRDFAAAPAAAGSFASR